MKRVTHKAAFLASLVVLLLAAVLYSVVWFYAADLIRTQIHSLYDDAAKAGVQIDGAFPTVSGFPGPHLVEFSGKLTQAGQTLDLPDLRIRGLFLPGRMVHIELPNGASLRGTLDPAIWSINALDVRAVIPMVIPERLEAEEMASWQQAGGRIIIDHIQLRKEGLNLEGKGYLGLDSRLQPAGTMTVRVDGATDFLEWMKERKLIGKRAASFAIMGLNGLSQTDAQTHQTYLQTVLTVKEQAVYAGPIAVIHFPAVSWPSSRQPLGQPQ